MPKREDKRRAELKEFLRTRREDLKPRDVGLIGPRRRRTPGLRREELASLAGVGVTWYTWLEQGRDIQASRETITRIARALELSPSDTRYLYMLANVEPTPPATATSEEIDPPVLRALLTSVGGAPALVMNPRFDVIAFNELADAIFLFDDYDGPFIYNHLWRGYMDPRRRRLYERFDEQMPSLVGILRGNYASRVGEPEFEALVKALREASPEFARAWDHHRTVPLELFVAVPLATTCFGRINVFAMRFSIPDRDGYFLVIYAPADDKTATMFATRRLRATGSERARQSPSAAFSAEKRVLRCRAPAS